MKPSNRYASRLIAWRNSLGLWLGVAATVLAGIGCGNESSPGPCGALTRRCSAGYECGGDGQCHLTTGAPDLALDSFFSDSAIADGADAATFFTLTVSLVGGGTSSVRDTTGAIRCGDGGSTCSAQFSAGTIVTLTVTSDATRTFTGWTGACMGTGPCTVTMSENRTVAANFDQPLYRLTVTRTGSGTGTVTSSDESIRCGDDRQACMADFLAGTMVTLTAAPSTFSTFAGWSDACSGRDSCSVTMTSPRTVGAAFDQILHTLTVSSQGQGMVTDPSGRISCGVGGTACSAGFAAGSTVTLTAAASAGWRFDRWSGTGCSGTNPSCSVTMSADRSVTATFVRITYTLTVSRDGEGAVSGPSISCPSTCSASYPSGTVVPLAAASSAGWRFDRWSGDCSGSTCSVTMSMNRNVTAHFARLSFTLSVFMVESGFCTGFARGTAMSLPPGISCTRVPGGQTGTCTASYPFQTPVTLTARPGDITSFTDPPVFTGDCSATGTCTHLSPVCQCSLTMTGNKTVTIHFCGLIP